MEYLTIIAMLALIEYMYFGIAVGSARGRYGISAPATTGDENFERYFRAHQNTLEQLIVFIPSLFAAGYFANEIYAVVAGLAFLVGRAVYFRSYTSDAQKRGPGMIVTMVANVALLSGGLVGALVQIF